MSAKGCEERPDGPRSGSHRLRIDKWTESEAFGTYRTARRSQPASAFDAKRTL